METVYNEDNSKFLRTLPRAEANIVKTPQYPPIVEMAEIIGIGLFLIILVYMMRKKIAIFVEKQPVMTKRIVLLMSVLWILFETFIGFDIFSSSFRFSSYRDRNGYLLSTYLPLLFAYGIYWVILGIKKEPLEAK